MQPNRKALRLLGMYKCNKVKIGVVVYAKNACENAGGSSNHRNEFVRLVYILLKGALITLERVLRHE